MPLLRNVKPSLPARWYYDADQYRRELEAVWYRDWVCVGRSESLPSTGDYLVATIGDQSVIVARGRDGGVRAFHNTCRHRGSLLCSAEGGRFRNGRIICPYHTWTYDLEGALVATPGRLDSGGFDASRYSLYRINADTWRGFVFITLAGEPVEDLETFLGEGAAALGNWPLETMRSVHRECLPLACNWKIFWENFSECYHCPRVHPELCRIMPTYSKAVVDEAELPDWRPQYDGDTGRSRVADGAATWTRDGHLALPRIQGLSDDEYARGVTFFSVTGMMFLIAHPDYVRSVRVMPRGPEQIELVVDWLLPAGTEAGAADIERIVEFPRMIMQQDGQVCALNQRGLKSQRHDHGVLVAQEESVWQFHEWLRARLDGRQPAS